MKKRLDALTSDAYPIRAPVAPLNAVSVAAPAPMEKRDKKDTANFVQTVTNIIPALGDGEFVVANVADALRAGGVQLEEKPNPRITTVLVRLEKLGVLERTFTGAGNVPNRYRVARKAADPAGDHEL